MNERACRTILCSKLLLLIVAALPRVALFAQTASPSPATSATATVAPRSSPSPAFEVTIVKPSKSGESGSDSSFQNGRFIASNVSIKNMIQYQAYGIPQVQIVG